MKNLESRVRCASGAQAARPGKKLTDRMTVAIPGVCRRMNYTWPRTSAAGVGPAEHGVYDRVN